MLDNDFLLATAVSDGVGSSFAAGRERRDQHMAGTVNAVLERDIEVDLPERAMLAASP